MAPYSMDLRERVARSMLLEMLRTTDGQVRDLEPGDRQRRTVSDYLQMVERKTARLFVLPLSGAAAQRLIRKIPPHVIKRDSERGALHCKRHPQHGFRLLVAHRSPP